MPRTTRGFEKPGELKDLLDKVGKSQKWLAARLKEALRVETPQIKTVERLVCGERVNARTFEHVIAVLIQSGPTADASEQLRCYAALPVVAEPHLVAFGLRVPSIALEFDFSLHGGIGSESLRDEILPARRRTVPEILRPLRDAFIREAKAARQKTGGRDLTNDPSFALVRAIDTRDGEKGPRNWRYVLQVRPCRYFDWLWPNTALDQTETKINQRSVVLQDRIGHPTLRAYLSQHCMKYEHLTDIEVSTPKLGTGTVFVTKDNYVVVSDRSPKLHIANRGYHLSVAEGVFATEDGSNPRRSCVFAAAVRGLKDELRVLEGRDYSFRDLRCLALTLDQQRVQPQVFFFLKSQKLTFRELHDRWPSAPDSTESRHLFGVPWTVEWAKELASGTLLIDRKRYLAASNHVLAGFALAARHSLGVCD